jgi:chemotaxis protein CheD
MNTLEEIDEVVLHPGEFWFGGDDARVRTLLGSCVAITMWHPLRRIGGMCHYMLPERPKRQRDDDLDGRYADEALELFFREMHSHGCRPAEFEVKLFGAGNMFPELRNCGGCVPTPKGNLGAACRNVSCRNATTALELAQRFGLRVAAESLGGTGSRQVIFDTGSGDVWVRQGGVAADGASA